MTNPADRFDLERFVEAQATGYQRALGELRAGRKRSHWIWYVLPQLRGLGFSSASTFYGIASLAEARAYLAHPVLGQRLRECVGVLLDLEGVTAESVLGGIDALKFRSSLTLFRAAAPDEPLFADALSRYFGGQPDSKTIALLEGRT
jgi:uncharacterized protein (DUF1810 family)